MKKDEIFWNDWQRIFVGDIPAVYFIEIVLRLAVVYLILVFSMRAMGKRMATQLTRTEYAALVSLAAATGMNALTPDRGLLPSVVIAIVLIWIQRFIARKASVNNRFEKIAMGNIDVLVEDGILNVETMEKTRITRERLFAELRGSKIRHLGEVQRFYFEAGGDFALLKARQPRPGMSVLPNWDHKIRDRQQIQADQCVCKRCGTLKKGSMDESAPCPKCGHTETENAVL